MQNGYPTKEYFENELLLRCKVEYVKIFVIDVEFIYTLFYTFVVY